MQIASRPASTHSLLQLEPQPYDLVGVLMQIINILESELRYDIDVVEVGSNLTAHCITLIEQPESVISFNVPDLLLVSSFDLDGVLVTLEIISGRDSESNQIKKFNNLEIVSGIPLFRLPNQAQITGIAENFLVCVSEKSFQVFFSNIEPKRIIKCENILFYVSGDLFIAVQANFA